MKEKLILFEGNELNPQLISKVWREGKEIKAAINGQIFILARYKYLDWAELGLRYLEFQLGRRDKWP